MATTARRLDRYKRRPGKNGFSGPNCTVLTISLATRGRRGWQRDREPTQQTWPRMQRSIPTVAIATALHLSRELGWPCISFLSEAATRMAKRRKGASSISAKAYAADPASVGIARNPTPTIPTVNKVAANLPAKGRRASAAARESRSLSCQRIGAQISSQSYVAP